MPRGKSSLEDAIERGIQDLLRKPQQPLTDVDRADREEKIKVLTIGIKWAAVKAKMDDDGWGGSLGNGNGDH